MSRSAHLNLDESGFSAGVELSENTHLLLHSTTPELITLSLIQGVETAWELDLDTISVRKLTTIFNAMSLHLDRS